MQQTKDPLLENTWVLEKCPSSYKWRKKYTRGIVVMYAVMSGCKEYLPKLMLNYRKYQQQFSCKKFELMDTAVGNPTFIKQPITAQLYNEIQIKNQIL